MVDNRKNLGAFGEGVARDHLEKRGYEIVQTNFRCPIGEIDIVARKDEYLVFAEVRTRRGSEFGTPEESVTAAKQAKLIDLAHYYIAEHPESPVHWRIDVVAIEVGKDGRVVRLEHIENAVD